MMRRQSELYLSRRVVVSPSTNRLPQFHLELSKLKGFQAQVNHGEFDGELCHSRDDPYPPMNQFLS